jgi:hypothetical protein
LFSQSLIRFPSRGILDLVAQAEPNTRPHFQNAAEGGHGSQHHKSEEEANRLARSLARLTGGNMTEIVVDSSAVIAIAFRRSNGCRPGHVP